MAFYLLLTLPHLFALCALLIWAVRVGPGGLTGGAEEESDGGGGQQPPNEPRPERPSGGLPLDGGPPPARRLRVGERLADLHPPVPRRDHEPARAPHIPAEP